MVPQDYEVIVHVRPDQHFPQDYQFIFNKTEHGWNAVIQQQKTNARWAKMLQDNHVYMSLNKFHQPSDDLASEAMVLWRQIPDDRLGFGLAEPMRRVFGTLDIAADRGQYDLSDVDYRQMWGPPVQEDADNKVLQQY